MESQAIATALTSFKGIRHRIEFIGEVDGVAYIDDSKGTNVDATLKAVGCMKRETVLLLGGKNKGYDYSKLFAALRSSCVVHAVLYGENRYELLKCARAQTFENVTVCDRFEFAVKIAAMIAKRGQSVLLSPASASFDEFASYEERGEAFVHIVRALEKAKQIQEQPQEQADEPDDEPGDELDEDIDGINGENVAEPAQDGGTE